MNAMDKKPAYSAISLTKLRKLRQIYGASAFLCLLLVFTGCDSNSGSGNIYSTDSATPFAELGSYDAVTNTGTGVGRYLGKSVVLTSLPIPESTCGHGASATSCFIDPDYQKESCVFKGTDREVCKPWQDVEVPAGGTIYYFNQKYDEDDTTITGPVCIFQFNTCRGGLTPSNPGDDCAVAEDEDGIPYPYPDPHDPLDTEKSANYVAAGLPEVVLPLVNSAAGDTWEGYNERGYYPGYRMYWRPSAEDDAGEKNTTDLFIFLNGGGACFVDKTQCTTYPNFDEITGINDPAEEPEDPFRKELYANPVKDWSYGFVPYCDGSLMLGDEQYKSVNEDLVFDYTARIQQGIQNVSAALDVIKKQFEIETNEDGPKRILLAGSSAGGFGTISAVVLVRLLWPDIPIYVMNDSGVGIAKWTEPAWINDRLTEWNGLGEFPIIPDSCPYCDANGNMTELLRWQLDHDPNLYMGSYSSYKDVIIGQGFMGITPDAFMSALVSESARIHEQFPKRFQYFHINGRSHTVLYRPKSLKLPAEEIQGYIPLFPEGGFSEEGIIAGYEEAGVGNTKVIQWLQGMLPAEYVDDEPPLPDFDVWKSLSETFDDDAELPAEEE